MEKPTLYISRRKPTLYISAKKKPAPKLVPGAYVDGNSKTDVALSSPVKRFSTRLSRREV